MNMRDSYLKEWILPARKEFFPFDPNMRDCFSPNSKKKRVKENTREKRLKTYMTPC